MQVQAYVSLGLLQRAYQEATSPPTSAAGEDYSSVRHDVAHIASEARHKGNVDLLADCDDYLRTH